MNLLFRKLFSTVIFLIYQIVFQNFFREETSKYYDIIKVGAFVISKHAVSDTCGYPDIPFSSLLNPSRISSNSISKETDSPRVTASKEVDKASNKMKELILKNLSPKNNSFYELRRNSFSVSCANDDFILIDLVIIKFSYFIILFYFFYLNIQAVDLIQIYLKEILIT